MNDLINLDNIYKVYKYVEFCSFLNVTKEKGWRKENLPTFLEVISKLPDHYKNRAFSELLEEIKVLEWIKDIFPMFFDILDKVPDQYKYNAFSALFDVIKEKKWIKEFFSLLFMSIDKLPAHYQQRMFSKLILEIKKTELINIYYSQIEPKFLVLLNDIDKLYGSYQYRAFVTLIDSVNNTELLTKHISKIKSQFLVLLNNLDILAGDYKYFEFSALLEVAKQTGLIEQLFLAFLESIEKFTGVHKYNAFSFLINSIKNSELLNLFHSQIKTQLLALMKNMHELREIHDVKEVIFSTFIEAVKETELLEEFFLTFLNFIHRLYPIYDAFSVLFEAVKETEWIKEHFHILLEIMYKLGELDQEIVFLSLIKGAREIGVIEEYFLVFLERIEKLSKNDNYDEYARRKHAFYELIDSVKNTDIMNIHSSQIETQFHILMKSIGNVYFIGEQNSFSALIKVAKEIGCITAYYPAFLEAIERMSYRDQYPAFSDLIISTQSNEFLKIYNTRIRAQYLTLLNDINREYNFSRSDKIRAFSNLIKVSEEKGWIEENFPVFLRIIDKLNQYDKLEAFSILFKVVEETEHTQDFLNKIYPQIEAHILEILKNIIPLTGPDQYREFYELIDIIKGSKLWNKFYSQIEAQFLIILESFDKITFKQKYVFFRDLIKSIKNTEILKDNYSLIETQFYILLDIVLYDIINPLGIFEILFELTEEVEGWLEEKFPSFLDIINKNQGYWKYYIFTYVIKSIKNTDLFDKFYSQIESQLLVLLNSIDKLSDHQKISFDIDHQFKLYYAIKGTYQQNELYSKLIHAVKGTKLMVKQFPAFLKTIDKLPSFEQRYAFSDLVDSITNIELLNRYYCQIESQFIRFLEIIDDLNEEEEEDYDEEICDDDEEIYDERDSAKYFAFSSLLKIAKEKDWFKELLPVFLQNIDKLPNRAFSDLLETTKEKGLIEELFPTFLEVLNLDKFSEDFCYGAFSDLFEIIKERGWIKEYFSMFLEFIYKFNSDRDKYFYGFYCLFNAVQGTRLNKDYFLALLESIERLGYMQKDAFYTLLNMTQKKGWREEYLSNFLKAIVKLSNDERYKAFSRLLEIAIEEEWVLEYFPTFLESLVKLSVISKNFEYRSVSYSFKGLSVSNVRYYPNQNGTFIKLLETAKEKGWMEKYLPTFLEIIENISEDSYDNFFAYFHLIQAIKDTELLKGYSSRIKTLLLRYIDGFDKFDYDKKLAYPELIKAIKNAKLENESDFKKFKEKYSEFSSNYTPKNKQGSGW